MTWLMCEQYLRSHSNINSEYWNNQKLQHSCLGRTGKVKPTHTYVNKSERGGGGDDQESEILIFHGGKSINNEYEI